MKNSRFRMFAVLLVLLALALSSCFAIRGYRINVDYLQDGETGRLRLTLKPISANTDEDSDDFVFLLIGLDNIDLGRVSSFDLLGHWGGPLDRVNDTDLRNLLLNTAGTCDAKGIDASAMKNEFDRWFVYRSATTVDGSMPDAADLAKDLVVNILLDRPAGSDDTRGDIVVFSGGWADWIAGANGIPEAGETECTAFVSVSIPYYNV